MKKILATILCTLMLVSCLAACGNKDGGGSTDTGGTKSVSLKVWGAQEDQEMLRSMVNSFKELNKEGYEWDITLAVVGENDTKTEVLKDVSAAADVFSFASDQLAELKAAGALYRITKNKDDVIARNSEDSVNAATLENELYAYPSSSDTYFLYYDSSKLTADDVKSLESIMAKDTDAGVVNFAMKIDDGWYNSCFFFAAGCNLFGENGQDATKCDFNSANGVAAGEYMIDLVKSKKFASYDDAKVKAGFESGKLASAISGTWNAADIQSYLGDNYATAKLPTIKLGGSDKNLVSMANFKFYGVNAQTKNPAEAMMLADYLTNEECQKVRFQTRSFAPTNKKLSADTETLSANLAISAVTEQTKHSILQTSIPQVGNFWSPAEAFGTGLLDGSITKANLQTKLDAFVKTVLSSLNSSAE